MPRSLRTATLAAKLGTVGALLMGVALCSIAFTLWVSWQLEGGAAAVNEAGRLRMQAWRMAQAAGGDEARMQALVAEFERSLVLLQQGDPQRPLFLPQEDAPRVAFDAVRAHVPGLGPRWQQAALRDRTAVARKAEALVADIDRLVQAIEASLARWTALLSLFQLTLLGLAIAAAVALLYTAHLFVFQPVARLRAGLAAVERGDLAARVPVESADEFGQMAQGFNAMAGRIEDLYRGLERKVAEKTETLRAQRERLAVLYDTSRFVAAAPTLQALADGFAQRVRSAARADAVLLRWHDAAQGQWVLLAADAVPEAMLAQERCLKPGQCHCAQPAAVRGLRVIPIQAQGSAGGVPGMRGACAEHGFRQVVSLPVRLQEQLLGEVDLLYREPPPALAGEDRALLETLATHLASGIEGMRLMALQREAAVSDERSHIARELHDSIAQALAFMKIQVQLLRGALKRGDTGQTERVLGELDTGVRESMADVRELLLHFRTRASGEGLVPALRTTLQKFQHQTGLPTQLQVHGNGLPLAPDLQVQVLHVVQEALSNVRKHAAARQVGVTLWHEPALRIEVRDDGRGFAAASAAPDDTHVGLRIMRERAAGIGAEVQVHSVPGQGTCVTLSLPVAEPVPAAAPRPALA